MSSASPVRVVIVPGNGCSPVSESNWYSWLQQALQQRGGALFSEVLLRDMPDPVGAREALWVPFLLAGQGQGLAVDARTIVVGHSSGAEAALRLMEQQAVHGCVLVGACHTDLGSPSERKAGYYSRPWRWEEIKKNAQWIVQFHSEDDPFIPRSEADYVANALGLREGKEYFCLQGKSHYFTPEDAEVILEKILEIVNKETV